HDMPDLDLFVGHARTVGSLSCKAETRCGQCACDNTHQPVTQHFHSRLLPVFVRRTAWYWHYGTATTCASSHTSLRHTLQPARSGGRQTIVAVIVSEFGLEKLAGSGM